MALTGFMKITNIKGESQASGHEDEIDIHDIQWSVEQSGAAQVGSGRTQSRAVVSPIAVRKYYDRSSPYVTLAALRGQAFDEVVLTFRRDSGGGPFDYLVMTLGRPSAVGYSMKGAENENLIEETLSIAFESINILYTVQEEDHSAGEEHEIEFDISAGA